MIHLLVTRAHDYTVQEYLQIWGRDLRGRIAACCYEDLAFGPRLAPGTYIFGDLERLTEPQMELARLAWRQMAQRPGDFRLLNDPSKVLRRYEMLKALHAVGINRFTAHKMNNGSLPKRFPLFLRRESEHDGALSPLLQSREEMDRALAEMTNQGIDKSDILAVEYCDTADAAGVYRKYSAFRVGDRILARHLFHSQKWILKKADLVEDSHVREEVEYLQTNPHEQQLREVFDMAHIEYGRIDYAMLDGRVQVWEINTNPTITVPPSRTAPGRLYGQGLFAQALESAWKTIEQPPAQSSPLKLNVPSSLRAQLSATLRHSVAREAGRAARWLARRSIFSASADLAT